MPPEASEPSRAKSSPGPLAQSLLIGGLAYTLLGSHVVDIFFLNPFIFLDVYHAPLILALLSAAFGIPFWLVCILLNRGGTTGTLGLRCSLVAMLLLNLWVLIRVHLGGVIREPSSVGPATAAILAIAVTAMFLLRHRTSNLVAISWIFLASVVIGNVYAIGLYVVAPALESAETVHEFSNVPAASPDRPHVFHILFDGMPGVSMQGEGELASQAFYRRAPSGVFYTNVFAQADYTSASIPQITRGIFAYRERLTTESLGESFRVLGTMSGSTWTSRSFTAPVPGEVLI